MLAARGKKDEGGGGEGGRAGEVKSILEWLEGLISYHNNKWQ